jgi:DNA replication protein DnaC
VLLSQIGAELMLEVFSHRYERGAAIVTSNLPFDEWTSMFASVSGGILSALAPTSCVAAIFLLRLGI